MKGPVMLIDNVEETRRVDSISELGLVHNGDRICLPENSQSSLPSDPKREVVVRDNSIEAKSRQIVARIKSQHTRC